LRVPKTIRSSRPDATGAAGATDALEVLDAGGAALTERVLALARDRSPADIVLLARVGAALLAPQVALTAAAVPVRQHVGPEVLERTGLRTALAYLRIAADPDRIRPDDLTDTLRRPARRLTGVITPRSQVTSLARIARGVSTVDPEHRAAMRRYVDDLALVAGLVRDGADSTRLVAAIRTTIGLGATLDALDRRRARPEGSSHGDDLEALADLALLQPDPRALPTWLADRLRATGAPDVERDALTLSTVHRVKGREWDVVVLVGLRAGLVPHRLCDDTEEERRVLHVALTRARQQLVLVTDPERPSPFLPELLGTVRAPGAAGDEAQLFAVLKAWRRERAVRDEVPAFLVAHDRTLRDLARLRPADRVALRSCHGIGPARLARYGDELLALLSRSAPGSTLARPRAPGMDRGR